MIVFKFGVRKILSGETVAITEMRDAHRLYNALVAIERWRRRSYADLRSQYVPGLAEIESAYEQLSEWIGEHSGPQGERGRIREKRKHASVRKDGTVIPTKRVDADEEIDAIYELKTWRKEAGERAKPLRDQFDGLVCTARVAYEARTCDVPIVWIERRNQLVALKKPTAAEKSELADIRARIAERAPKTHAKGAANARVLAEMLTEDWNDAWKDLARLDATAHELRHWVSEAHSLNHGTYVAVYDDVARAGKRPPPRPDGEPRRPRERPAFSRIGPGGGLRKIGWQIQKPTTWGDVLAGRCGYIRVSEMRPQGGSGHRWRATVGIRLGKEHWVESDVAIHRPVPEDTRIRWVYLVPERRCGKIDYSVQLTAEPTKPLIVRAPGTGHVEVALRWTQVGDTLDVASMNGTSLVLPGGPRGIVAQLRFAESLRSAADRYFDEARDELVKRLPGMPADVQARCATIAHWHRHDPLREIAVMLRPLVPRDVILEWRTGRLRDRQDLHVPFSDFFAWAESHNVVDAFACWLALWRAKDIHLDQMAEGTRRRAMLRRREFYRVTAARLTEQYATCSLAGAVDLAALAIRDKAEDSPRELHQEARHNRVLAATYELKEALEHAFGRERFGAAPNADSSRDSGKSTGSDAPEAASDAAE